MQEFDRELPRCATRLRHSRQTPRAALQCPHRPRRASTLPQPLPHCSSALPVVGSNHHWHGGEPWAHEPNRSRADLSHVRHSSAAQPAAGNQHYGHSIQPAVTKTVVLVLLRWSLEIRQRTRSRGDGNDFGTRFPDPSDCRRRFRVCCLFTEQHDQGETGFRKRPHVRRSSRSHGLICCQPSPLPAAFCGPARPDSALACSHCNALCKLVSAGAAARVGLACSGLLFEFLNTFLIPSKYLMRLGIPSVSAIPLLVLT
jgi:hypothetical protein